MRKIDYDSLGATTGNGLKRKLSSKSANALKLLWLKEADGISKDDTVAALIVRLISSDDKGAKVLCCAREGEEGDENGLIEFVIPEISFLTMNAGGQINEQNESRMWLVECDSGTTQNNRVVKESEFLDKFKKIANKNMFELRARAWQQCIIPLLIGFEGDVFVPYLEELSKLFVAKATPIARHAKKFLKLIEIITKMHAAIDPDSRTFIEKDGIKYSVAEPCDYNLTCEIAWKSISGTIHHLTRSDMILLENLQALTDEAQKEEIKNVNDGNKRQSTLNVDGEKGIKRNLDGFTSKDICSYGEGVELKYGRKCLRKLLDYGYVTPGKSSKDSKRVYTYLPVVNRDVTQDEIWRDTLLEI